MGTPVQNPPYVGAYTPIPRYMSSADPSTLDATRDLVWRIVEGLSTSANVSELSHLGIASLADPGLLTPDILAELLVWSHTDAGYDFCELLGEDPDLWVYSAPPIIALHNESLYVLSPPHPTSMASMPTDFAATLKQVSPMLHLVDVARLTPTALRSYIELHAPFLTPSAERCLETHGLLANDSVDTVQLSHTRNRHLVIHASATHPVIETLRSRVHMQWQDSESGWVVDAADTVAAADYLRKLSDPLRSSVEALGYKHQDGEADLVTLHSLHATTVDTIPGVGPRRASAFAKVGITSLYDLLLHAPRRYMDRSNIAPIASVATGEEAALIATIRSIQPNAARRILRLSVSDASASLTVTFFNALWMAKRYSVGDTVILLGKIEEWRGRTRVERQMTNPVMEPYHEETLPVIPVYPQSAKHGVSTWEIRRAVESVMRQFGQLEDPVPAAVLSRQGMCSRESALKDLHFPPSLESARLARRRLSFDELFRLQISLLRARKRMEEETGIAQSPTGALTERVTASLPFALTSAQQAAWADVLHDIQSASPMHRLIQGDVGSGKTLIAILSLLATVEGGNQGALMAPTEILASQLYEELVSRLRDAGLARIVNVSLLTSKTRAKEKRGILEGLGSGTVNIVVGTHSLISENVVFSRLGLVVIDEQHRFGVEQRAALRAKVAARHAPDMLVMTATPIPRTAAITAFGDLDVSVIGELPPGRTPIDTVWVNADVNTQDSQTQPWDDVIAELRQGKQAFVVCPLVEGSEKMQAASAQETFHELASGALAGWDLRLVHGQQSSEERAAAMDAFINGEANVLVATTVIEVGVNIPNATRIVVLNAERFGIAQLHQLRGRVGRGKYASRCYLVGSPTTTDGAGRLQALVDSTDGFYLSEVDLELRGAGNILGSEQSGGMSDFRVAEIMRDRDLLELARHVATEILDKDPELESHPALRMEISSIVGEQQSEWLFKS